MQISVLASGSKGNCLLIAAENTALLIDAGISTRKIKQELASFGMDITDLDGILITHEHSDHVRGLKTLVKNYRIPIYSKANTFKAMPSIMQNASDINCFQALPNKKEQLSIGNFKINYFATSHDAVDSVGYSIKTKDDFKFTLATDLGFVSEEVKASLDNSNIIVLEANHDINLLQNGTYPWPLKKRILSTRGHLSNNDAGWTLCNLNHTPDKIILAHLSEKNNSPTVALNTIKHITKQKFSSKSDIFDVATVDNPLPLNF